MTSNDIQALYECTPFTRAECRWLLQQKERRKISDTLLETLITAACIYGMRTVDRMLTAISHAGDHR